MSARRIEVWGTFDVANVGDLLYPLVLERELEPRLGTDLGALELVSPIGGRMPLGVNRPVRAVAEVEGGDEARRSNAGGIVLGGGDILRVEPEAAAGLVPGAEGLYRYDPFIGALAVLAGEVPVVWNGVGVPSPFDDDAAAAVRLLAERSRYVSVRDEASRAYLHDAGVTTDVAVVPDPALVVDRVFPESVIAAALGALRERAAYPVAGPVLAFQVSFTSLAEEVEIAGALSLLLRDRADVHVALVPLGPCHGDGERMQRLADAIGPRAVAVQGDITLAELVAAVAGADAFIGSSLHGNVIAARYRVPGAVFAVKSRQPHKLLACSELLGRAGVLIDDPARLATTATTLLDGGAPVDVNRIDGLALAVAAHYDRIATELHRPHSAPSAIRRRSAGGDAVRPDRRARAAADAALGRTLHALETERRSIIDRLDRVQRHADEVERARRGLESRIQELATKGAAFVREDHARRKASPVIDLERVRSATMHSTPYHWGIVDEMYEPADRRALIETFPVEPFSTIRGDDGEKSYEYEARCLVAMGGVAPWRPDLLSDAWFRLATDLCSRGYRDALATLIGRDLTGLIMEVNAFHYGPGSWLGPHVDLPEKIVTHVLYFNDSWDTNRGGCLRLLGSGDESDVVQEVPPVAGSSVVLERCDVSWHAVSRVVPDCHETRRSVTVTFYPPGSISTMWQ